MSNRKQKNSMDFVERLQSEASDIARAATFLVESRVADWQVVEMPDGQKWIALLFKPTVWQIEGDKLKLRK